MKAIFVKILLLVTTCSAAGQSTFDVHLDTFSIPNLPGLHSFAFAKQAGKWLLLGGRKDGLHHKNGGFQTSAANQSIYVVDPLAGQVWAKSLTSLPDTLQEQLRSANMEFFQSGETLLFAGGYGRSETLQDHTTYPFLTLINVPGLMDAVVNGDSLAPHFQQVRDTFFAVTGGQLQVLGDTFYLVGGHRFEGLYSANAGTNNIQFYTNAIRKFALSQGSGGWEISHKSTIIDELNLHRRDYNLVPSFLKNGESGICAFSGVFQPGLALLPFQNMVEIKPGSHAAVNGFTQYLANYHCPKVPLYSVQEDEMHTLFFGGMSQYYLNENDSLIKDNRIPFVKTVSRVSRLSGGTFEEVAFDAELPFFTGSSAEFIPAEGIPALPNGVVDYDLLPDGETMLGYIVGGIVTPPNQPNPFVGNQTGLTTASAILLKVFLVKNPPSMAKETLLDGQYNLQLKLFPNPSRAKWNVHLLLPETGNLHFTLQDLNGKILRQKYLGRQPPGAFQFDLPAEGLPPGAYNLTLNLEGIFIENKLILKMK
jgi:hypothetical protein